jgi:hypothetical protein
VDELSVEELETPVADPWLDEPAPVADAWLDEPAGVSGVDPPPALDDEVEGP